MTLHSQKTPPSEPALTTPETPAARIMEALTGIRFGSVEITVHEGRVVQIERREKFRPQATNLNEPPAVG
ncbi:YezD family protein [Methylococcus mesophilus]|uniref:YezD family protein n=1 Tax=Methylococcus mesophilus TaxID=2993564 RepID=UPI00224B5822|nr:YezD family protein [Methylococcus mesophilus]UZR30224.1 YezD family protein [Methylococcus mesophilus]